MGTAFWLRRFGVVLLGAFMSIAAGQYLRGRGIEHSLVHGLGWGAIAAGLFTAVRLYHSRRGGQCALCRDVPDLLD